MFCLLSVDIQRFHQPLILLKKAREDWRHSSLGEYLPAMQGALGPSPVPHKPNMLGQANNSSTQGVEAGQSEFQSYPWLHSKFEASLSYMRSCSLRERRKKERRKENHFGENSSVLNMVCFVLIISYVVQYGSYLHSVNMALARSSLERM